jgi:hypothetical protein
VYVAHVRSHSASGLDGVVSIGRLSLAADYGCPSDMGDWKVFRNVDASDERVQDDTSKDSDAGFHCEKA